MLSPGYNSFSPDLGSGSNYWDPSTAFKAGGGANENGNLSITSLPTFGPYFGSDLFLSVPQGDPNAIPSSQQSGGSSGGWQTGLGQFIGAALGTFLGTSGQRQQQGGAQTSCPQDYRAGYHRDPATCQWIENPCGGADSGPNCKNNNWWIWLLLAFVVLVAVMAARKG